jgi:hypothetical protein
MRVIDYMNEFVIDAGTDLHDLEHDVEMRLRKRGIKMDDPVKFSTRYKGGGNDVYLDQWIITKAKWTAKPRHLDMTISEVADEVERMMV